MSDSDLNSELLNNSELDTDPLHYAMIEEVVRADDDIVPPEGVVIIPEGGNIPASEIEVAQPVEKPKKKKANLGRLARRRRTPPPPPAENAETVAVVSQQPCSVVAGNSASKTKPKKKKGDTSTPATGDTQANSSNVNPFEMDDVWIPVNEEPPVLPTDREDLEEQLATAKAQISALTATNSDLVLTIKELETEAKVTKTNLKLLSGSKFPNLWTTFIVKLSIINEYRNCNVRIKSSDCTESLDGW
jgi:hypothetical protein